MKMQFLKTQFSHLSLRFYLLLFSTSALILTLSLLSGGGFLSILVALFGVAYAFFAGQGKLVCFFFGLLYSLLYAYIAYEYKLYGDMMLNILYIPINLVGIFLWSKNQNQEKSKITIRSLSFKTLVMYAYIVMIVTLLYGVYLQNIGASFAYLNAFSVVAQIVAFYLQVKRYVQNYFLVTLTNITSIVIWWLIYDTSKEQIAQLLNTMIFFIVGVYYYFEWKKEIE